MWSKNKSASALEGRMMLCRAQRAWRRNVQLPYWVILCVWRHHFGRWHVFRDAPDWFVRAFSMTALDDHADDEINTFIIEATREWGLRARRRRMQRGA